jgi:hypothetical protein
MIVEHRTFELAAVVGCQRDDSPLPSSSTFAVPRSWEWQERKCRQGILRKRGQGKWIKRGERRWEEGASQNVWEAELGGPA